MRKDKFLYFLRLSRLTLYGYRIPPLLNFSYQPIKAITRHVMRMLIKIVVGVTTDNN